MCFSDVWVGNGGWVLVVSFFAMGFDFGMGIDYGDVVVGGGNFFFFNFSGGELLFVAKFWWKLESGCVGLPERETEGKKRENELFILFNIVGYTPSVPLFLFCLKSQTF